jgi:hypothetical protein
MNPSALIDREIAHYPDGRGQTMAEIRRIISETVPDVTEEWKWMGTPTWSHNGTVHLQCLQGHGEGDLHQRCEAG